MKRARQVYVVLGVLLISIYALGEILGREPASAAIERIDPTVRHPPGTTGFGGSFWHSGFHGGK